MLESTKSASQAQLKHYRGGGGPTSTNRTKIAQAAGLSKDQQVQAVRIARVPDDEFDTLVEGDTPPTMTELGDFGRQRPVPPRSYRSAAATELLCSSIIARKPLSASSNF